MFDEKKAHICFLILFFVAEAFALVCFVCGYVTGFSVLASRLLFGTQFVLFLFWLTLVLVIKVFWNLRYLEQNPERIPVRREDVFVSVLVGGVFVCFMTLAAAVNRVYIHCALFQLIAYISFFWDFRFVRPKM